MVAHFCFISIIYWLLLSYIYYVIIYILISYSFLDTYRGNTMTNSFLANILASTIAGIGGTVTGAIIAIVIGSIYMRQSSRCSSDSLISVYMGFSGGIMMSIICLDLLPSSLEYAGARYSIIGVLSGCILIPVLDTLIHSTQNKYHSASNTNKYSSLSMLILVGIALHNLPEGIALGAGFSLQSDFGITLAIVIMLHNIPEGIALASPMLGNRQAPSSIIVLSTIAGAPTLLGAIIGWILGTISQVFIGMCLGFAGGAMLYVVVGQIFPLTYQSSSTSTIYATLIGFFLGLFITIAL